MAAPHAGRGRDKGAIPIFSLLEEMINVCNWIKLKDELLDQVGNFATRTQQEQYRVLCTTGMRGSQCPVPLAKTRYFLYDTFRMHWELSYHVISSSKKW